MLEFLVATVYAGQYIGQETLFGLTYGDGIALPIETLGIDWQPHDLIAYWTKGRDGQEYLTLARAVDAGPFGNHCVMQPGGFCASIWLDVPINLWQHGEDTSAILTYFQNISAQARAN